MGHGAGDFYKTLWPFTEKSKAHGEGKSQMTHQMGKALLAVGTEGESFVVTEAVPEATEGAHVTREIGSGSSQLSFLIINCHWALKMSKRVISILHKTACLILSSTLRKEVLLFSFCRKADRGSCQLSSSPMVTWVSKLWGQDSSPVSGPLSRAGASIFCFFGQIQVATCFYLAHNIRMVWQF